LTEAFCHPCLCPPRNDSARREIQGHHGPEPNRRTVPDRRPD
jgi:hypothetical protein